MPCPCLCPSPWQPSFGSFWWKASHVLVENFPCSVENTPIFHVGFKQIRGLNSAIHACSTLQHRKIGPANLEFLGMKLMSITPIFIIRNLGTLHCLGSNINMKINNQVECSTFMFFLLPAFPPVKPLDYFLVLVTGGR